MAIKRYKPEQIVTLLRQIEVGIANGKPTPQACNEAGITVQTYYRWRKDRSATRVEPRLINTFSADVPPFYYIAQPKATALSGCGSESNVDSTQAWPSQRLRDGA